MYTRFPHIKKERIWLHIQKIHGKKPRQILTANSCLKFPQQIPAANPRRI